VSESAIAEYLDELDRELRLTRTPRRRLLAEAADHLSASADEIAASGLARGEAERAAVRRFGDAVFVARRFAYAVASTAARTALIWAATACTAYAVAAAAFILMAPDWLRDFPQGAPSMLALQVALVALVVSAVRALRLRRALLIDELRVRLIGNGVVIATLAIAGASALELLLALTRPAAAPWRDASTIIAIYAVAAATAFVATLVAVATLARTRALAAMPRPRGDELPAGVESLVDDVAEAAPPLRPVVALMTSRPVAGCASTAALAFVAMALVDAVGNRAAGHGSQLVGAAATGLFEAIAVVVAYATLARALGLGGSLRGEAD
jgi:hypothetical protein